MLFDTAHLTYCTNIHAGESWEDHFNALQKYFPAIKQKVSPYENMGLGLRLSNTASEKLSDPDQLDIFKKWLDNQGAYIFTMNGFPYGGFHHTRVKDDVHTPDWTTHERLDYTIRLFHILKELLPDGLDGGISTSPLSYRHWYKNDTETDQAKEKATLNIIRVVEELIQIAQSTSKQLHLDIEPEPDGLLETGEEFISWYTGFLLPLGIEHISKRFNLTKPEAEKQIKNHLQLCYDVCHFAIGYEDHEQVCKSLHENAIKIGKIQISAALKSTFDQRNAEAIKQAFSAYDEPTYLHQVVARNENGSLKRYADLSDAITDDQNFTVEEWRAHFHVPVFLENFGLLQSTNNEIRKVLSMHQDKPLTNHLEVETYTWEVLPPELKLPIQESISRELLWIISQLNKETNNS